MNVSYITVRHSSDNYFYKMKTNPSLPEPSEIVALMISFSHSLHSKNYKHLIIIIEYSH